MTKPPAFQFYAQDWLSSIDISLMTLVEEGAYHRLLCWAWTQDDCGLPADDESLAKLSRLDGEWIHSKEKILKKFRIDKGRLFNDRLLTERRKQEAWRAKCSKGGKTRAINAIRKGSSGVVQGLLKGSSSLQSSSSLDLSSNGGVSTDQIKRKPPATMPPPQTTTTVRTTLNAILGKHGLPQFDEPAALRLVRALPDRPADVIVSMCEVKLGQNREAILSGKIQNVIGFLLRTVPKMAEVG